jgi:hypothetical protein
MSQDMSSPLPPGDAPAPLDHRIIADQVRAALVEDLGDGDRTAACCRRTRSRGWS